MTSVSGQDVLLRILADVTGARAGIAEVQAGMSELGATTEKAATASSAALARVDSSLAGAATAAGTATAAVDRLGVAAKLAAGNADVAFASYRNAAVQAAAGVDGAAAAATRFQGAAVAAAAKAREAMAAYTAEVKGASVATAAAGAEAGAAWAGKFKETGLEAVKGMMGPLIAIFAVVKIAEFFSDAVKDATNAQVQVRRVGDAFGEASEQVKAFTENSAASFGYTSSEANKAAADYGDALHSFGVTGEQAATIAVDLTQRAGDIAASTGNSIETVENAIASALKGRGQQLSLMGVKVTQATILQEAQTLGLVRQGEALTLQDTALAAHALIMGESANVAGRYMSTQNEVGRSEDQLRIAFAEFSDKVGTAVIPVLGALATVIKNSVLPMFSALFGALNLIFKVITLVPQPILSAVTAFGLLLLLRGPLSAFFDMIVFKAALATEAIGAEGLASALTGTLGILSGGWGIAIAAGVAALIGFSGGTEKATTTEVDFSGVVDANTGKLLKNADALSQVQLAQAGRGDDLRALNIELDTYSKALTGTPAEQDAFRTLMANQFLTTVDAQTLSDIGAVAARNNVDMTKAAEMVMGGTGVEESTPALEAGKKLYEDFTTDSGNLADQQRHVAQGVEGTATAMDLLTAAGSSTDDVLKQVLADLDALTGRAPKVEDAIASMYTAINAAASDFNLGKAGQIALTGKIVNPDGSVALGDAGGLGIKLQGQVEGAQSGIANAALAKYADDINKGKTPAEARADAQAVITPGLAREDTLLRQLIKDPAAVAALEKHFGLSPDDIIKLVDKETQKVINPPDATGAAGGEGGTAPTATDPTTASPPATAAPPAVAGSDTPAPATAPSPSTSPSTSTSTSNDNGYTGGAGAPASAVAAIDAQHTAAATAAAANSAAAGGGSGVVTTLAPGASLFGTATGQPGIAGGAGLLPGVGVDTPGQPDTTAVPSPPDGKPKVWPDAVTRWKDMSLSALAMLGEPAAELGDVYYRINLESSGNPAAVNDPKGTGGARGLVQVMGPTFKEFALAGHNTDIMDPLSNLTAGMAYAKHTYGSVKAGFDRPGSYDGGGWLPPDGIAVSGLRQPEAVLNPQQWDTAKAAMNRPNGVTVGPITINVTGGGTGSFDFAAQQQLREQIRVIFQQEAERAL